MKRCWASLWWSLLLPWLGVGLVLAGIVFFLYAAGFYALIFVWLSAWVGFLLALVVRRDLAAQAEPGLTAHVRQDAS